MAPRALVNRSEEEVLDQAARLVAGTINPDAMGLTPEQVDVEHFIEHFKEIASTQLTYKDALYLAIGTYVNTDGTGVFSIDMQAILEWIETQMRTEFHFYHGLVLWLCKNDLYVGWLPS